MDEPPQALPSAELRADGIAEREALVGVAITTTFRSDWVGI